MLVRTSAIGSKNAALSNKPLSAVPEPDCRIPVLPEAQRVREVFRKSKLSVWDSLEPSRMTDR